MDGSIPTIQRCYARFLEESNNPDYRESSEDADPIREVLIHSHYLSQKDIEICAAFDIVKLPRDGGQGRKSFVVVSFS